MSQSWQLSITFCMIARVSAFSPRGINATTEGKALPAPRPNFDKATKYRFFSFPETPFVSFLGSVSADLHDLSFRELFGVNKMATISTCLGTTERGRFPHVLPVGFSLHALRCRNACVACLLASGILVCDCDPSQWFNHSFLVNSDLRK